MNGLTESLYGCRALPLVAHQVIISENAGSRCIAVREDLQDLEHGCGDMLCLRAVEHQERTDELDGLADFFS